MNPLLVTLWSDATVSFTLYTIVSLLLAVQVNSTVVPSTAATEEGLTRITIQEIDLLKNIEENLGLNIFV